MELQVRGNYVYVTCWDKQAKRPRRFYIGKKEDYAKLEELIRTAKGYTITKEEVSDYLNYYLDKSTNLTKVEYVFLSLSLGVGLWKSNGGTKTRSGLP